MKIVETFYFYHYEVIGEKEAESAEELEQRLDFAMRDYSHNLTSDDLDDLRISVAKKYNVKIAVEIGVH